MFSPAPDVKDVKEVMVTKPEGAKCGAVGDHLAHHGANESRREQNETEL